MAAIAIMLVGVCCMSSSVGGTAFGLGFIPEHSRNSRLI